MTIVGKANSPKNIKKVHLDVHIADTREQQKTGKKTDPNLLGPSQS